MDLPLVAYQLQKFVNGFDDRKSITDTFSIKRKKYITISSDAKKKKKHSIKFNFHNGNKQKTPVITHNALKKNANIYKSRCIFLIP